MKGKYCCFFCPSNGYEEKNIEDKCPNCGRKYSFPLEFNPTTIGDYTISRSLNRGFYGCAYIAERGAFKKKNVIKISPVSFYEFFKKSSFEEETNKHAELANSASHVIAIEDRATLDVQFGDPAGSTLRCNVSVLEFVDGTPLSAYLGGILPISASAICQIAIDLLRMRSEFEMARLNHNDLHADNIIVGKLNSGFRRPGAIDDSVMVKAIDLGSVADSSKSSEERKGDLTWIANHVDGLLAAFLKNVDELEDREHRVALSLQLICNGLQASGHNHRNPNAEDLTALIVDSYEKAVKHWKPWNDRLSMRNFGDHYNAQTLGSWNVPRLLVDPDNKWIRETTKPGPQIITGMRGCGKTMLLRALDIHARASLSEGEAKAVAIERIRKDAFVGLFVSAQRLLDLREQSLLKIEHRLTRLFVHYALEAVRALLHISDLDDGAIATNAHGHLAEAISSCMSGSDSIKTAISLDDLERRMERIAVQVMRGNVQHMVSSAAAHVFPVLAEAVRSSSRLLSSSTVFYLLDDVSTRYLDLDKIESLLSSLLIQSPICAFKFTSEWQTIELGLQSPGRVHPIRVDRDLSVFDLGADVYEAINGNGINMGNDFISKVLSQRSRYHSSHPSGLSPSTILGDVSLEQVAREIVSSKSTSKSKQDVYRGITCLTNVCVGDLGDVIKIYEDIVRRGDRSGQYPISQEIQSDCFRNINSRRLYDLNRRRGYFKDHAMAFADAAVTLLVRSHQRQTGKKAPAAIRLRQYSSIYVRITSDDAGKVKQQIDQLRDLIDAGVFVFAGGSARTKAKDSNPIQQFKLAYRKIYGLSFSIGLADRDRFELSGSDLESWLSEPGRAKEILLRNQINSEVDTAGEVAAAEVRGQPIPNEGTTVAAIATPRQESLFDIPSGRVAKSGDEQAGLFLWNPLDLKVTEINPVELPRLNIKSVVTGLGFEDRTLASNALLSTHIRGAMVHAVSYALKGQGDEIRQMWQDAGSTVNTIHSHQEALSYNDGDRIIDISGLSKPYIFTVIRNELLRNGKAIVCHARAKKYYPLQEDIDPLLELKNKDNPIEFLERLAGLLKGEVGPYADIQLLNDFSDNTRTRSLLAFSSAKHERLFSLLDKREYDKINILSPLGNEPRYQAACIAADFLCTNYTNSDVIKIPPSNLSLIVKSLDEAYMGLYLDGQSNVEIGLTGSKQQTLATAILCAQRKISQVWYLSPKEFDDKKFSSGVGDIQIFEISIKKK